MIARICDLKLDDIFIAAGRVGILTVCFIKDGQFHCAHPGHVYANPHPNIQTFGIRSQQFVTILNTEIWKSTKSKKKYTSKSPWRNSSSLSPLTASGTEV